MANSDPDADVLLRDISSVDDSDVEDDTLLPDQSTNNNTEDEVNTSDDDCNSDSPQTASKDQAGDATSAQVSNLAADESNSSSPSLSSIKRSGLLEFRLSHPTMSADFKTIDRQMKSIEKTISCAKSKVEGEYLWLTAYKSLLATAEKRQLNVISLDEHIPALRVEQGPTVQDIKTESTKRRGLIMQIADEIDWDTGEGPEYKLIGGVADELPLFYPRQLLIEASSDVPNVQMLATLNNQLEDFIKQLSSKPRMRKYGSDGETVSTCFSLDVACHYANFFSDLLHVEGLARLRDVFTSASDIAPKPAANLEYRLPTSAVLKMTEYLNDEVAETREKAFYRSLSKFAVAQQGNNAYERFYEYFQCYQASNVFSDMVSNLEYNNDDQTTRDIVESCGRLPHRIINNIAPVERVTYHICTYLGVSSHDFMSVYDSLVIMHHMVSKFGIGVLPLLPHDALSRLKIGGCDAYLPEMLNELPLGLNPGLRRIANEIMPVISQSTFNSITLNVRQLLGDGTKDVVGGVSDSFCSRIDAALQPETGGMKPPMDK